MLVLHYTGMASGRGGAGAALRSRRQSVGALYRRRGRHGLCPCCRRRAAPGMRAFLPGRARRDINARSIGIELVNPGHEFGYRDFPDAQIQALITLCHGIFAAPSHSVRARAGPQRCRAGAQRRSGRAFPWVRLAKAGIGLWPQAVPAILDLRRSSATAMTRCAAGNVVTAFQRHFRPQNWTEYGMGNAPACWLGCSIKLRVNAGHVPARAALVYSIRIADCWRLVSPHALRNATRCLLAGNDVILRCQMAG